MVSFHNILTIKNETLNSIMHCVYGETTLLAYCEGYLPHALFRVQLYPSQLRRGVTVYLFPIGSEDDVHNIVMIEARTMVGRRNCLKNIGDARS